MSTDHTPRVPPEAVSAAVSATRSTEPWCELAISAALPAIHAERDRAWQAALKTDEALAAGAAALEDEIGLPDGFEWPCGSTDEALRPALQAAATAALDSLQVSGAGEKCETCGGTEVDHSTQPDTSFGDREGEG